MVNKVTSSFSMGECWTGFEKTQTDLHLWLGTIPLSWTIHIRWNFLKPFGQLSWLITLDEPPLATCPLGTVRSGAGSEGLFHKWRGLSVPPISPDLPVVHAWWKPAWVASATLDLQTCFLQLLHLLKISKTSG
jgi:hypothetical protein